ncbi:HAMP domain-containing sensor histidine kinase [Pedobacter sp. Leaf132]|uniref:sensor histidine kinase n=1 Tax=Pedobacter sp. Leaf132 TaxID=2876557 RepID=UPI001E5F178B|nr:HAMP domain-containing sensor histidine kinase [Pedobacter sp. Leaf132]
MKLFSKYNRILILISFVGLLVIGLLFYQMLIFYLNRQLDHDMVEEVMEVKEYSVKGKFYTPHEFEDLVVQYKPIEKVRSYSQYGDTLFYNSLKHQNEHARFLRTEMMLDGEPYQITVIASKMERQEQIKNICLIILLPVCILLIVVLLVNRMLLKKIWDPFSQMLKNINDFNINHDKPYRSVDMPVEEFKQLNQVLIDLSGKVKKDYEEIKLFTENASHEMMTPLAVINSRLDNMLQSSNLDTKEGEMLSELYQATSRLTRLNQSLLLLVKIDHNLLQEHEDIDLCQLIQEKTHYFHELLQERSIQLKTTLLPSRIIANRQLIEILINNLFSNVIRHNYEKGSIEIYLDSNQIIFANTAHHGALDAEKIFDRFYKGIASEGTGLGLAILKQICIRQHYLLNYTYQHNLHTFIITFNNQ